MGWHGVVHSLARIMKGQQAPTSPAGGFGQCLAKGIG
jgi:hypothetical protein